MLRLRLFFLHWKSRRAEKRAAAAKRVAGRDLRRAADALSDHVDRMHESVFFRREADGFVSRLSEIGGGRA